MYLLLALPRTNFDTIHWRIFRMASGCVLSEVRNELSQLTRISYFKADTWLWRLVACPSVQSLGFYRSRASPCDNCGGRSSTGIGFLPVLKFSLVRIAPPILHSVIRATSERIFTAFEGWIVLSEVESHGIKFISLFRFRGLVLFNKNCNNFILQNRPATCSG